MDETTLTRTLRDLAANPPLHTAPAADARHRAHRLQRHRRTEVGALAVVAIVATLAVARPLTSSSTSGAGLGAVVPPGITAPDNPNRATTAVLLVDRGNNLQYAIYWHDSLFCEVLVNNDVEGGTHCAPGLDRPDPVAINRVGTPDYSFVTVARAVSKVVVHLGGGSAETLPIMDGVGWPARVAVVPGPIVNVQVFNSAGNQIGPAVPGDSALQIRQVTAEAACGAGLPGAEGPYKDRAGKECYTLAPEALAIQPKAAQGLYDSSQGYLVQVDLNEHDRVAFGALTTRVAPLAAPLNQLAIVLDGVVVSAPTVQTAIDGGFFQITGGATGFTKDDVNKLAAELNP